MVKLSFKCNKKNLPITVFIIVILLFIFVGKPHLRRRNALNAFHAILTYWENNDLILAASYWEKEQDSPPVYDLLAYDIGEKEFGRKDGIYNARITVTLYFSAGNTLPSERKWIFELNKSRHGWKVVDFRLKK